MGEIGKLEAAEEVRLETRVRRSCVGEMLARVGEAHPYDEMAYDIYTIETPRESPYATGLVGRLAHTTTLKSLATRLQRGIPLESLPTMIGGRNLRFDGVAIHSGNKPARVSEIARSGLAVVISENVEQPPIAGLSSPGIGALLCDYDIPRARAMENLADSLADSLPLRKHKVQMDRTIL